VEHLCRRNAQLMQLVISGGRNQGINVMDEGHVRLEPPNCIFDFAAGFPRINSLRKKQGLLRDTKMLDLVVVPGVEVDLIAMPLEQFRLGLDNRVFASKLLVSTVDEKNPHVPHCQPQIKNN